LHIIVQILIYALLGWLVVAPINTLLHELGHAIVVLFLTNHGVTIQFGNRGSMCRTQIGRLKVILYLEPGVVWGVCRLEDNEKIPLNRYIWIIMGGPVTSLLLTILFGSLALLSNWNAPGWILFAAYNLIVVLLTVLPLTYPKWTGVMAGMPSDMLQAWRLIQQSRRSTQSFNNLCLFNIKP
jgi:hypothetical protein